MLCILLTQNSFVCKNLPVDTKAIIKNADATICFWFIEIITLILEYSCLKKNSKTMD